MQFWSRKKISDRRHKGVTLRKRRKLNHQGCSVKEKFWEGTKDQVLRPSSKLGPVRKKQTNIKAPPTPAHNGRPSPPFLVKK